MTPGPGSTGGSRLPQLLVSVLLLCGALSAVGCVLLAIARQPRSAADTDLEPSAVVGQGG